MTVAEANLLFAALSFFALVFLLLDARFYRRRLRRRAVLSACFLLFSGIGNAVCAWLAR